MKTFLRWVGNAIALTALILSFETLSLREDILITFLLGLAYLVVVFLSREGFYLYPTLGLFAVSYLLLIQLLGNFSNYLLFTFPLFFLYSGLGLWIKDRFKVVCKREEGEGVEDYSTPFNVMANAAVLFLAFLILYYQNYLTNLPLVWLSLLGYLMCDLALYQIHRNGWYLLPGLVLFALVSSLSYELPYLLGTTGAYLLIIGCLYLTGFEDVQKPLYTAGIGLAFFFTAMVLLGDMGQAGNAILCLSALIYILAFLTFGRQEFIYLVILSLGVLMDNFIKIATNPFYHKVVDYLLYAIFLAGILFLYPFIKRTFNLTFSLAQTIAATQVRTFYVFIPAFFLLLYFAFDYTMIVTKNSQFCSSCHIMKPQFDSWQRDIHYEKGVSCVDCHYPPGLANFLKGRMDGILMVAKNTFGFYGTRHYANLNDAGCLKEGCHQREKLYKKILCKGYKKSFIKFNHELMHAQKSRGIELHCNSCHAKVEGKETHFETPSQICYFCHLMGVKEEIGTAIGTCFTCHDPTKERIEEKTFVTLGDGKVPKERCLSCHLTIERFEDTQYQHDVHMSKNVDFTKRKIECGDCHTEIRHGELGFASR